MFVCTYLYENNFHSFQEKYRFIFRSVSVFCSRESKVRSTTSSVFVFSVLNFENNIQKQTSARFRHEVVYTKKKKRKKNDFLRRLVEFIEERKGREGKGKERKRWEGRSCLFRNFFFLFFFRKRNNISMISLSFLLFSLPFFLTLLFFPFFLFPFFFFIRNLSFQALSMVL